jgi:hypothetical protein
MYVVDFVMSQQELWALENTLSNEVNPQVKTHLYQHLLRMHYVRTFTLHEN